MNSSAAKILATIILATGLGVANAGQMNLDLNGTAETPPVTTKASGLATLTVDGTGVVSGGIKTTGIDGTAAHIHMGQTGSSGPPIITLKKAGKGQWMVPEGSKLTTEQYEAYKRGNLYINVHSKAHPSGEIRAQLNPAASV
jgi:CHRD domain